MVKRVFAYAVGKVALSGCEVTLEEGKHSQDEEDLGILRVLTIRCLKSLLYINEVNFALCLLSDLLVIRVVFKPL